MIEFRGRVISKGYAKGEALISRDPISFYGGVDPERGIIIEKGHDIEGESIADKVLIFPRGKGSTVGTYILYGLKVKNLAPKAIINIEAEPIIAVGAIISNIPMIDNIDTKFFDIARNGDIIEVDGYIGIIRILK